MLRASAALNAAGACTCLLYTSAPLTLPSTAYFCACIYAYIGKKVTTTGELQDALADVKAMMLREPRTHSIFQSGVGTAIAAEMIEACKYVKTQTPYEMCIRDRASPMRGRHCVHTTQDSSVTLSASLPRRGGWRRRWRR